nr:penicillin-binding transpeptidase domain-containing protein [uncultured Blautia sp.]
MRNLKSKNKKRKKLKRPVNREYTIVSYFFVLIFLSLAGYMVYFNAVEREDVISSPYNTRQNQFQERILRGSLISADGQVLARTDTDGEGNETRVYPFANMYAHVVGYDAKGKSGLESLANFSLMTSHNNYVDQVKNEIMENKNPGDNVVLTLNHTLQQVAYNALGSYQGAVVVMNPQTGAVLASVSKPDFNPNTVDSDWEILVNDSANSSLLNRATQGAYPPGSIFKVVDALAYLREHGTIDGFQYTCNGKITVDGHTIPCFGGEVHGTEDFTTAFAESCNTAFTQMGLDLGKTALTSAAESLLFNAKLPVALDYNKSKFDLGENPGNPLLMQTSIGQGNTLVSPMHMALITSAIANKGKLMEPYYIDHVETASGRTVETTKPKVYKELMTESEAQVLKNLMAEVVTRGTGTQLSGETYSAAGKTGSAEYYGSDGSIKTHSWFIGFSNVENPDLAVAVIAEGAGTGSKVAVPVAHEIFNAYYYGGM